MSNIKINSADNEKDSYYLIAVLSLAAIFAVVFSYLSILRFNSFQSSAFDMGIMIQVVWNTSEGWFLQESVNMGFSSLRFWVAHWEFIYIFIAMLYKLFSTPYTLLIFQSVIVSLGAIPIYYLAKKVVNDNKLALLFSLSYLLYPAIQNATLFDIHGVTLAAPFLIFTFYYLQEKKFKLFVVFGVIALLCREDSSLLVFMMGLYAYFFMKEKKIGIFTACVSIIYFVVWYKRMTIRAMIGLPEIVIMEGAETHWEHLSQVKGNPLYLIKHLLKIYNIKYFINLLGPVGFLSLLSPALLLIASPIFAINLLSDWFYAHGIEHHYSATITPFIFISAIYGTRNLINFLKKKSLNNNLLKVIYSFVISLSLLFFFLESNAFDAKKWKMTDHHKIIKKVISKIPQDASLTAEIKLVPHAAERHNLYAFNDHVYDADYILYDFYAPTVNLATRKTYHLPFLCPDNDSIRKVISNREYGIVHYEDGVCLLKNGANFEDGVRKLAIAQSSEISNSLNTQILPNIFCKGYNTHKILNYYVQQQKLGAAYWKKAIHFTCFWKIESDSTENYDVLFKIQNENFIFHLKHVPVFDLYPTSNWKRDELIRDEIFKELPKNVAPGIYKIYAAFSSDSEEDNFVYLFDFDIK